MEVNQPVQIKPSPLSRIVKQFNKEIENLFKTDWDETTEQIYQVNTSLTAHFYLLKLATQEQDEVTRNKGFENRMERLQIFNKLIFGLLENLRALCLESNMFPEVQQAVLYLLNTETDVLKFLLQDLKDLSNIESRLPYVIFKGERFLFMSVFKDKPIFSLFSEDMTVYSQFQSVRLNPEDWEDLQAEIEEEEKQDTQDEQMFEDTQTYNFQVIPGESAEETKTALEQVLYQQEANKINSGYVKDEANREVMDCIEEKIFMFPNNDKEIIERHNQKQMSETMVKYSNLKQVHLNMFRSGSNQSIITRNMLKVLKMLNIFPKIPIKLLEESCNEQGSITPRQQQSIMYQSSEQTNRNSQVLEDYKNKQIVLINMYTQYTSAFGTEEEWEEYIEQAYPEANSMEIEELEKTPFVFNDVRQLYGLPLQTGLSFSTDYILSGQNEQLKDTEFDEDFLLEEEQYEKAELEDIKTEDLEYFRHLRDEVPNKILSELQHVQAKFKRNEEFALSPELRSFILKLIKSSGCWFFAAFLFKDLRERQNIPQYGAQVALEIMDLEIQLYNLIYFSFQAPHNPEVTVEQVIAFKYIQSLISFEAMDPIVIDNFPQIVIENRFKNYMSPRTFSNAYMTILDCLCCRLDVDLDQIIVVNSKKINKVSTVIQPIIQGQSPDLKQDANLSIELRKFLDGKPTKLITDFIMKDDKFTKNSLKNVNAVMRKLLDAKYRDQGYAKVTRYKDYALFRELGISLSEEMIYRFFGSFSEFERMLGLHNMIDNGDGTFSMRTVTNYDKEETIVIKKNHGAFNKVIVQKQKYNYTKKGKQKQWKIQVPLYLGKVKDSEQFERVSSNSSRNKKIKTTDKVYFLLDPFKSKLTQEEVEIGKTELQERRREEVDEDNLPFLGTRDSNIEFVDSSAQEELDEDGREKCSLTQYDTPNFRLPLPPNRDVILRDQKTIGNVVYFTAFMPINMDPQYWNVSKTKEEQYHSRQWMKPSETGNLEAARRSKYKKQITDYSEEDLIPEGKLALLGTVAIDITNINQTVVKDDVRGDIVQSIPFRIPGYPEGDWFQINLGAVTPLNNLSDKFEDDKIQENPTLIIVNKNYQLVLSAGIAYISKTNGATGTYHLEPKILASKSQYFVSQFIYCQLSKDYYFETSESFQDYYQERITQYDSQVISDKSILDGLVTTSRIFSVRKIVRHVMSFEGRITNDQIICELVSLEDRLAKFKFKGSVYKDKRGNTFYYSPYSITLKINKLWSFIHEAIQEMTELIFSRAEKVEYHNEKKHFAQILATKGESLNPADPSLSPRDLLIALKTNKNSKHSIKKLLTYTSQKLKVAHQNVLIKMIADQCEDTKTYDPEKFDYDLLVLEVKTSTTFQRAAEMYSKKIDYAYENIWPLEVSNDHIITVKQVMPFIQNQELLMALVNKMFEVRRLQREGSISLIHEYFTPKDKMTHRFTDLIEQIPRYIGRKDFVEDDQSWLGMKVEDCSSQKLEELQNPAVDLQIDEAYQALQGYAESQAGMVVQEVDNGDKHRVQVMA